MTLSLASVFSELATLVVKDVDPTSKPFVPF